MNDIAADVDSQIAADGAGLCFKGLGGTDQLAGARNDAVTFPDHGHHRAGGDELNKTSKKRTLLMDAVVLLCQLTAGGQLLEAHQLETLALETPQNLTYKSTLNTIGLNGDKGAFGSHNNE